LAPTLPKVGYTGLLGRYYDEIFILRVMPMKITLVQIELDQIYRMVLVSMRVVDKKSWVFYEDTGFF
jgi:hypothetical protein